MGGLNRLRCARVIGTGHACIHNLRRGHYELGRDADPGRRLPAASPKWRWLSDRSANRGRIGLPSVNATVPSQLLRTLWLKLISLSGRLHNRK
jgi:hypothetical protein